MKSNHSAAPGAEPDSAPLSRRKLLKGALALGAARALAGSQNRAEDRPSAAGAVARENQKPGTRDWLLSNTRIDPATKYRCPWIEGYCSRTSVQAGGTIGFHVSANPASPFTLDIYRMGYYGGAGGRQVASLGPFPGKPQQDPPVGKNRLRECDWERAAEITVPKDWLSGVYIGKLTSEKEGLQSYVIFIVRDERRADFIFQCSDTTWQAYNRWPSQFSLYDDGKNTWYWGTGVDISFRRPYGKYCQIFDAPLSTGSGEWFLWEFPVAYWMESQGYDVTYVSNLDTHARPEGLARAKGFLSVGHDEYYTIEMYRHLKEAIANGLHVAFLSGNTCCGRIEPVDEIRKAGRPGPFTGFRRTDFYGPRDPEDIKRFPDMGMLPHESPNANLLVGARSTSPITGGGPWVCSMPDHWVFEGTGMKAGEGIPGLVGWEWHGDPAQIPGLEVVSTGPTDGGGGKGIYTATIYPGPKRNFVFNASTCWWGDGLSAPPGYLRPAVYTKPQGPDPRAQRITRNILERIKSSGSA